MIKKILQPIVFIILFLSLLFIPKVDAYTFNPIDRIDLYEITVNPRNDGTLDIEFNIEWTVLDSSIQGPLEWIKIGIPNYEATDFKKISKNISKIGYMSDFGSFIRIDLDRAYVAGETINIRFSYHQSRMYFLTEDKCSYHYVPGYFSEIQVKKAIVKWNSENVLVHNALKEEDGYLVWEESLNYDQKMEIRVEYNQNVFTGLSHDLQFMSKYISPREKMILVAVIVCFILLIYIYFLVYKALRDPYMYDRGFIGRRYYGHFIIRHGRRRHHGNGYHGNGSVIARPNPPSSGGGSSGGFSCACACACAGGGRAGCSKKDFYNTNLKSDEIIKCLENEK